MLRHSGFRRASEWINRYLSHPYDDRRGRNGKRDLFLPTRMHTGQPDCVWCNTLLGQLLRFFCRKNDCSNKEDQSPLYFGPLVCTPEFCPKPDSVRFKFASCQSQVPIRFFVKEDRTKKCDEICFGGSIYQARNTQGVVR